MKCPACKEGRLKLVSFKRRGSYGSAHVRDKGLLACDSCGYREKFE